MSYMISGKHGDYKERKIMNGNIAALLTRTKALESVHITVEPGKTLGKAHKHDGEEFKFVIEGTLEFQIGDVKQVIGAGGWLHHECSVPHTVSNNTSKKAVYISVAVPPGCMAVR